MANQNMLVVWKNLREEKFNWPEFISKTDKNVLKKMTRALKAGIYQLKNNDKDYSSLIKKAKKIHDIFSRHL